MAVQPLPTEFTTFSKDVLGRYVCNRFEEASGGQFAADVARPADRPDARPFDVIVIGGGSFGPILAQHLFEADESHSRRVLVLEAGRFTLPEHQQNLPIISDPAVWEVPWSADTALKFKGLAVLLGGRSTLWGGWSPRLLDAHGHTEFPRSAWPQSLVDELTQPNPSNGNPSYLDQAAVQLGVDKTNDFIFGDLHRVLRKRLAYAIDGNEIPAAIPLDDLDVQVEVPPGTKPEDVRQFVLEAPLAVQSSSPRAGAFAYNKFSSVPLLVKATRAAQGESGNLLNDTSLSPGDDAKKRVMAVPNFRVTRLETVDTGGGKVRVTRVHGVRRLDTQETGNPCSNTEPLSIPIAGNAMVVIALGTIECARLAMLSFPNVATRPQIGTNLMAHLRSNIVMRMERSSLPPGLAKELQSSALFMKGVHNYSDGSGSGYFHLQITSAGLNDRRKDDHDELFINIPDIDGFEQFLEADDDHVVITIRGIGEMSPDNDLSRVTLVNESYCHAQRAHADINPSSKDDNLWEAMDDCSNDVARSMAGGKDFEIRRADGIWVAVTATDDLTTDDRLPYTYRDNATPGRRDRLGTTHHEAGTLRLGESPDNSVCDINGKLHDVDNAYALGPALFPTIGSPNPMLTGTAFSRRMADHLVETMPKHVPQVDTGFTLLFDGKSFGAWKQSRIHNLDHREDGADNPGRFIIADGTLESTRGTGLGMVWFSDTDVLLQDFELKLEWLRWRDTDNSGVLLRFPDPRKQGYRNEAYVPDTFGFEVQIDEHDPLPKRRTGAIYDQDGQTLSLQSALPAGQWNLFQIRVRGHEYTVFLNGDQVTHFVNPNGETRGRLDYPFIGLQSHFNSRVAYRNIQYRAL